MIEEALYTYLIAHAGLSALVGDRVYPLVAPQDATYPLVVYQRISGIRIHSHSGPSGLASPRFQFSAWGESFSDAKNVAEQVRLALDGYAGTMGSLAVGACLIATELDQYEPDTGLYRTILDFFIWHEE